MELTNIAIKFTKKKKKNSRGFYERIKNHLFEFLRNIYKIYWATKIVVKAILL